MTSLHPSPEEVARDAREALLEMRFTELKQSLGAAGVDFFGGPARGPGWGGGVDSMTIQNVGISSDFMGFYGISWDLARKKWRFTVYLIELSDY